MSILFSRKSVKGKHVLISLPSGIHPPVPDLDKMFCFITKME